MAYDKFLISYNSDNSGLQTNLSPWLIMDEAFEQLNDCYVFRGKVQKRFGSVYIGSSQFTSQLNMLLEDVTYMTGVYSGTVPGAEFNVGQMFLVGDDTFTVTVTGTPGNMLASNVATSGTYNTSTGAFTITGEAADQDIYFYPAQPVMGFATWYDSQNNTDLLIAFDTQFSYSFDLINANWDWFDDGDNIWTGTDAQFFWSTQYIGETSAATTVWTSNFNVDDGIRYIDTVTGNWKKVTINWTQGTSIDTTDGSGGAAGTVAGGSGFLGQVFSIAAPTGGYTWFTVAVDSGALIPTSNVVGGPVGTGTFDISTGAYTFTGASPNQAIYFTGKNYVATARLIVQFKNRLLLLNTVEVFAGDETNYPFRVRFSGLGSPLSAPAWFEDQPGNGGAIDAPTEQQIVTAQFIKDRLIVYFEDSTYELAYTGNQVLPFAWQKLNTELGAISTFSEIPFDKAILGVDDSGIHACNGSNVDRIDESIPQYPFSFSNQKNGPERVAGIRDFYNEMAYWTIPTANRNDSFYFPNQVLVYNYINESWATITDSYTTFGYYLQLPGTIGATWGNTITPWGQDVNQWNSQSSTSNNIAIKSVIGGNQQGFVAILKPEVTSNAATLSITNFSVTSNIITVSCINHNLDLNAYVLFSNMNGLTFTDSEGNVMPQLMARVTSSINAEAPNSFTAVALDNFSQNITIAGTYLGGGVAQLVNNINILTKQYNFYNDQDRNMYLAKTDFLVSRTTNGQVTADYLVSSSGISLVSDGIGSIASPGPLPGNSTLETSAYVLSNFEQFQARLWHPIYMWGEGECVQLQLYMSPNQMESYKKNDDGTYTYTALNDFKLHAMNFYVTPTSNRMQ